MAVKSVILLGLYIIPFVLIVTLHMNLLSMLLLSVVIGIGMAGTAMSVMHDSVHGSFSKRPWLNKLMGVSMYMLGGNVFNWKVQHNILHHTFTNIQGYDEDIRSRVVIRLSQQSPLLKMHRFQHIYAFFLYGFMTLSQLTKDFWQLWKYNKTGVTQQQQGKPRKEYFKLIWTKICYLAIVLGLPVLFTHFNIWQVLLGFLLMHITAGVIMSTIFQMAHIVEGADQPQPNLEGNIENEWAIHQLNTTANFAKNNLFLNWYIGGLNFQIEHHLFPNICHVHYREIAPIVEKTALDFGLPYNMKPTFINALASHLRMLKELGRPMPVAV